MTAHDSRRRRSQRRSLVGCTVTAIMLTVAVTACTSEQPDSSDEGGVAGDGSPPPTASSTPTADSEITSTTVAAATTTTSSPVPVSDGAQELGPLGETEVQIETDEGNFEIGGGNLPAELDSAFPLPSDLIVEVLNEQSGSFGFNGTTQLTVDAATALYIEGLPEAGYDITERNVVSGSFALISFSNDSESGQVAISEAPGVDAGSTVIVTFGD